MSKFLNSKNFLINNIKVLVHQQSTRGFKSQILINKSKLLNSNQLKCASLNLTQYRYETNKASSIESVELIDSASSIPVSIFSDSPITKTFEELLVHLHDAGSFEWATTIFLSALLFRLTICFPIRIYQEHLTSKVAILQPLIKAAVEDKLKYLKNKSPFLTPEMKKRASKEIAIVSTKIYKEHKCELQKIPIASLMQLPFWLFLSTAIRDLSRGINGNVLPFDQISKESFLWVDSLSSYDPTYIIPGIFLTFALANIKYNSLLLPSENMSGMFKFKKYFSIFFMIVLTTLIANMPVSIGLFWISSNFISFCETVAFDSIFVRRLLRIPKTPQEHKNIYVFKYNMILKGIKSILKRFK